MEPPPDGEKSSGRTQTSQSANKPSQGGGSGQLGSNTTGALQGSLARGEFSDEEQARLSSLSVWGDVLHHSGDAKQLPVTRQIAATQSGESTVLTLAATGDILKIMLDGLEKVVDGNSHQVVSHLGSDISKVVSSMLRDVATPLSNHLLRLKDVVQNHIKSVW